MGIKEDNLKKLSRTTILATFVKKNKGEWDHAKWEGLVAELKKKGYDPIDADQVGLMIEQKKAEYMAKNKKK
jgi:hypothetical protein